MIAIAIPATIGIINASPVMLVISLLQKVYKNANRFISAIKIEEHIGKACGDDVIPMIINTEGIK